MDPNERKGWTEIITPDDLDRHMAEIGQAETNAYLVVEMLNDFPLEERAKLLVPGCGTGQIFDYITPAQIGKYNFTFTDLNPNFFNKLKIRLSKFLDIQYNILQDDIEDSKVSGHYSGALIVMLLHHIEWKKGIDSILRLNHLKLYFIIQEQNEGDAWTLERDLAPSIKKFTEIAHSHLVPRKNLIEYLTDKGYTLLKAYDKEVPDNKIMVGLVFEKRS